MLIHNAVITGSLTLNGTDIGDITGSEAAINALNIFSSSIYAYTASNDTTNTTQNNRLSSLEITSGSLLTASGSFSTRVTTLETASGSFSTRVTNTETTASNLTVASSSFSTRVTNNEATGSNLVAASASFSTRTTNLETASGSFSTRVTTNETNISNLQTASGSFSTRVTSAESSIVSLQDATGSYATTGSNNFVNTQRISATNNAIGFTSTASLYTDGGLRVAKDAYVSGTLYLNNLTVYGTQSVQYITASQLNISTNIISVNTDTPSIRYGGLSVYDSGSTGLTGSLLWDSEANHWIYTNPSGSTYSGGMLISGPRASALGNEQGTTACALMMGQGGDHITSSGIFHYGNATCFYGNATIQSTGAACFASTISLGDDLTLASTNPQVKWNAGNLRFTSLGIGDVVATITQAGITCFASTVCAPSFIGGTGYYSSQICSTGNSNTFGAAGSPGRALIVQAGCTNGTIMFKNCSGGDGTIFVDGTSTSLDYKFNTYSTGDAFVIKNGGNVGIGTASPNTKLEVAGTIRVSSNGTNGGDWGVDDSGIAISSRGSTPIAFWTNDFTNQRLRITAAGIACFACQVCSPAFVGGTVNGTTGTFSSNAASLTFGANDTVEKYMTIRFSNGDFFVGGTSVQNYIYGAGSRNLALWTNSTQRFLIDGNGVSCFACQVCASAFQTPGCIAVASTSWIGFNGFDRTHAIGYDATVDGVYVRGQNGLRFITGAVGGTERMRLDACGNLGLGSTPDSWASGWRAFNLGANGAIAYTGAGANDFSFSLNSYYDSVDDRWEYRYTGDGASRYSMTALTSEHRWFVAPVGTANAAISWNQAMTLKSSGNLGLGTTTPCALLQITTPSTNSVLFPAILNNPYNDGVAGYGVGLRLQNSTMSGTQELNKWAGIAAIAGGSSGYSNETDLAFYVGCFILAANCTCPPVEKMRIKSSTGNVGIGTTSPCGKLHIQGTGTGESLLYFCTGGSVNTKFAYHIMSGADDAFILRRSHTTQGELCIMSWTYQGRVGIGTITPEYPFHIYCCSPLGIKVQTCGSSFGSPGLNLLNGAVDTVLSATNSGLEIGTWSAHNILFKTVQQTRATIFTSGETCFACTVCAPNFKFTQYGSIQSFVGSVGASATKTITICTDGGGVLNGALHVTVGLYVNGAGGNSVASWIVGGYMGAGAMRIVEIARSSDTYGCIGVMTNPANCLIFTVGNCFAFNGMDYSVMVTSVNANTSALKIY